MELPHLGQHCSSSACKQLDFLPTKCDACGQTFCKDHIHYDTHSCAQSYQKDNQVPVCPLCNAPCPVKKGESADVVVGRHIDNDCMSDPAKERRKIYTNKCSYKSCKQKELIPVKCDTCHKNYCLRHRHEQDHKCQVFQGSGQKVSNAGAAAVFRSQQAGTSKPSPSSSSSSNISQKSPQQTALAGLGRQLDQDRRNRQAGTSATTRNDLMPGNMTEDEALRYAMQMSMATASDQETGGSQTQLTQEQEDAMLARALAASEEEGVLRESHRNMRQRRQEKNSCQLS